MKKEANKTRLAKQKEVASAIQDGFEAIGISYSDMETVSHNGFGYSSETDKILGNIKSSPSSQIEFQNLHDFRPDNRLTKDNPLFGRSIIPVIHDDMGTPDKGYIPWGKENLLPNFIFQTAYANPYTARSLGYIEDQIVGQGCEFMYRFSRLSNGTVVSSQIPYEDAGMLILAQIKEVKTKLAQQNGETANGGNTINMMNVTKNGELQPGTLEFELQELYKQYETWETTSKEVAEFCQNNNIAKHMKQCMTNFVPLEMYFPLIGLSRGLPGKDWEPKIVSIKQIDCCATRVEEMDENRRINYVYYSDLWRGYNGYAALMPNKDEMVAYPALPEEDTIRTLRKIVGAKKKVGVRSRPTWFCIPRRMPSMNALYYTHPKWWSIYTSHLIDYVDTIIADRAAARLNSTMFGKLIMVNRLYLEKLWADNGCDTSDKRKAYRKKLKESIDAFLRNRANNGATAMFDSVVAPDGQTLWDAIRIIDVPLNADKVQANKAELAEISNAIFLAMGIHSVLMGNEISASSSTGGTVQRELDLLKSKQLAPMQKDYLDFLTFIQHFNNWDIQHGVWVAKTMSLTTLDNSKTGMVSITNTGEKTTG